MLGVGRRIVGIWLCRVLGIGGWRRILGIGSWRRILGRWGWRRILGIWGWMRIVGIWGWRRILEIGGWRRILGIGGWRNILGIKSRWGVPRTFSASSPPFPWVARDSGAPVRLSLHHYPHCG